ncbi:alpha/beta-hydrolase, partial [Coprinopsis marcescibilis]
PSLAGPIGLDCAQGSQHSGEARGRNISIVDIPTYYSRARHASGSAKVVLFFSDIYSPFFINNQLLQDQFASEGFHVVGIDYFLGDPIQNNEGKPGFNRTEWSAQKRQQALELVPKWIEGVKGIYGTTRKDVGTGYCFGAPYAVNMGATDDVVATAFAHPSGLTEAHFTSLTKPVLLSCAETDTAFPAQSLRRANDILTEKKGIYHLQIFSGVSHGFATRADLTDPNAAWAKEQSAKSVIGWFKRFST